MQDTKSEGTTKMIKIEVSAKLSEASISRAKTIDIKPNMILWQHIPVAYLIGLFECQSLFFKNFKNYSIDDEKDPFDGYRNYIDKILSVNKVFAKSLEALKQSVCISCWYCSDYISDLVFRNFTNNGYGIAVKTTVCSLCDCLQEHEKDGIVISYGSVAYGDHLKFNNQSMIQIDDCFFLKKSQYHSENEFRIVSNSFNTLINSSLGVLNIDDVRSSKEDRRLKVDFMKLIDSFVVYKKNNAMNVYFEWILSKFGYKFEMVNDSNMLDFNFYKILNGRS